MFEPQQYELPTVSKVFRSWLNHWIKNNELPYWNTPTGFITLVPEYNEPFDGYVVVELQAITRAYRQASAINGIVGGMRPVEVERCLAIKFEADVLDERKIRLEAICVYEPALAYFERVIESIRQKWPELAEPLIESTLTLNGTQEEGKPWEQIPDHLWYRRAVKLWCERYTAKEIGDILNVSEGRVRNCITELRRKYPEVLIPYHQRQKKT